MLLLVGVYDEGREPGFMVALLALFIVLFDGTLVYATSASTFTYTHAQ